MERDVNSLLSSLRRLKALQEGVAPEDRTPISILVGTARKIINYNPKIMATEISFTTWLQCDYDGKTTSMKKAHLI